MALMGFILTLGIPGLTNMVSSFSNNAYRAELSNKLGSLPIQARSRGELLVIEDLQQLEINAGALSVTVPIVILKNGFCLGGEIRSQVQNPPRVYSVSSPYCNLDVK